MRYENAILIDAPAAVVWDLTMDLARWPELSPTMQRVEPLDVAPLHVGSRVKVKQPMQRTAIWTVTDLEPRHRFVWETRRPGLVMVGGHLVEDLGGSCRNTLSIALTGRGASLFGPLLGGAVRRSIAQENEGFRKEAERIAGQDA